jgi:hypothetical protein
MSRLSSVVEYAQRVRQLEQSDIATLSKLEPSDDLRDALETLSGGLLTGALTDAFLDGGSKFLARRAGSSRPDELLRALEHVATWKQGAEVRLSEIQTNIRRRVTVKSSWPTEGASHVELQYENGSSALKVTPAGNDTTMRITDFSKRCGFLLVDEDKAGASLRFYSANDTLSSYHLGSITNEDGERLNDWAQKQLAEVGSLVTSGKAYESRMKTVGVGLADRLMQDTAQRYLHSFYGLVDTLVIITKRLSLPWEWIWPVPQDVSSRAIGDQWRIIRWPAGMVELSLARVSDENTSLGPFCSAGFVDSEMADIDSICRLAEKQGTLHLVGRQNENTLELAGGCRLDHATIAAHAKRGLKNTIISGCDIASMDDVANLASAFALNWRCATWAPLVSILHSQASTLDAAIKQYVGATPECSLDGFMKKHRQSMPFLKLYSRYGFHFP